MKLRTDIDSTALLSEFGINSSEDFATFPCLLFLLTHFTELLEVLPSDYHITKCAIQTSKRIGSFDDVAI